MGGELAKVDGELVGEGEGDSQPQPAGRWPSSGLSEEVWRWQQKKKEEKKKGRRGYPLFFLEARSAVGRAPEDPRATRPKNETWRGVV